MRCSLFEMLNCQAQPIFHREIHKQIIWQRQKLAWLKEKGDTVITSQAGIMKLRECLSITSASFPWFWSAPLCQHCQCIPLPYPLICWCNIWTEDKLLHDLYGTFQIIKVFFIIRMYFGCVLVCVSVCVYVNMCVCAYMCVTVCVSVWVCVFCIT